MLTATQDVTQRGHRQASIDESANAETFDNFTIDS